MLRPDLVCLLACCLAGIAATAAPADSGRAPGTYTNPLSVVDPATGPVITCPDPAIIKSTVNPGGGGLEIPRRARSARNIWYLYCTDDPHNNNDVDSSGKLKQHLISIFDSTDLVHWTYLNDALPQRPSWVAPDAPIWAPAIKYFNNQYYLYYAAQNTVAGGAAIGVATSADPAGPFLDKGSALIAPQNNGVRWVIDPDTTEDDSGQKYILFGSYVGGISIRKLSADGLTADPASEQPIAIDNRYEGGNFVKRNGYYYLFASSGNCCAGPLTGYSVWVGRATSPTGPYLDKQGLSMLSSRPGGTPVLTMNGNRFVGPGGNVVFTDEAGQDYILYHAVDLNNWYIGSGLSGTARPVLLDPLDWIDGWPVTRGGYGPSDAGSPQPLPAAQPRERNRHVPQVSADDQPGTLLSSYSDDFNGSTLSSQWTFIHTAASWRLTGSAYETATVNADLVNAPTQVPLLAEDAPSGDYLVEAKVSIDLPVTGCCYTYPQVDLVIYHDDQNFLRADVFGDYDTRQAEFVKAATPVSTFAPSFSSTPLGPPGDNTWLRIARRTLNGQVIYTPYSSGDGVNWVRGGTWTLLPGGAEKIGLAASTGAGFTADVDYVHVWSLP